MSDVTTPVSGIRLLKEVCNPNWLQQPAFNFMPWKTRKRFRCYDWHYPRCAPGAHSYDKSGAYVGAAGGVLLGVGAPELVSAPTFDARRAGSWHIIARQGIGTPASDLLPSLIDEQDSWQYTPIVCALLKSGYEIEVQEAWLYPETHAVLRSFYERIRQLRQAATTEEQLRQVKYLYTSAFGTLAHEPKRPWPGAIFRPDWWYTLVAESKARMFYQMQRVLELDGIAPVRVKVDCIWYPQQVTALPLGNGIGQYKYELDEGEVN